MRFSSRSLRSKILIILIGVVATFAGADYAWRQFWFPPMFQKIEDEEARRQMQSVREALSAEQEGLTSLANALGHSTAAWLFVRGEHPDFVALHLEPNALERLDLDFLVFVDKRDQVCWSAVRYECDTEALELPAAIHDATSRWVAVFENKDHWIDGLAGIRDTKLGPVMMAASPVIRSESPLAPSAEPNTLAGVVVAGRLMDEDYQARIAGAASLSFNVRSIRHAEPSPDAAEVLDEITSSFEATIVPVSDAKLHVYDTLDDIKQAPSFLVLAEVDRPISRGGNWVLRYARNSTLAASCVLLLALISLLQRTVLAPLSDLTRHAVAIGSTEDLTARANMVREDEIGVLAGEFDEMVEKLERAQAALVEAARSAGMSEIATGILHNVGNVLNSVNVSASMLQDRVKDMGVETLGRVVKVLDKHKDDMAGFVESTKQGKQLGPVLSTVHKTLARERETIAEEVAALTEGIEHIRELITSQQAYAGRSIVEEAVSLQTEIESALRLSTQAHGNDADLVVEHDFEDLPRIETDKHKLLEILVNLFQNARQAMSDVDGERRIAVSLERDGDVARITIRDTGVGIEKADLARIFAMGYTTKPNGSGFGLHTSGNAATELGGSLRAESDGPGTGATFILDIPYRPARVARADAA